MRIDGTRPNGIVGPAAPRRPTGGAPGFTLPEEPAQARAATVSANAGVYDLASLVALQAVEGPPERRRKALKRGFDLLDALDALRLELLDGSIAPERLEGLAATLARGEASGEPKVDALLEEIELRARVELAKRGRYPD
jgi:hypothetical protein